MITNNCEHFANMAILGINYSQEIAEKGHLAQNTEALGRGATIGAGVAATGIGIGLAPFTFGLSLIPAAIAGVSQEWLWMILQIIMILTS